MSAQIKTKHELLREMQQIHIEVENKKQEVELLLNIIDQLEKDYDRIAEEINNNN